MVLAGKEQLCTLDIKGCTNCTAWPLNLPCTSGWALVQYSPAVSTVERLLAAHCTATCC